MFWVHEKFRGTLKRFLLVLGHERNGKICIYNFLPTFINVFIIQTGYIWEFPNCLS